MSDLKKRITHLRLRDLDGDVMSKGGVTICALVDPTTLRVDRFDAAWCSINDNFCRREGRVRSEAGMNSSLPIFTEMNWNELLAYYQIELDHAYRKEVRRYNRAKLCRKAGF